MWINAIIPYPPTYTEIPRYFNFMLLFPTHFPTTLCYYAIIPYPLSYHAMLLCYYSLPTFLPEIARYFAIMLLFPIHLLTESSIECKTLGMSQNSCQSLVRMRKPRLNRELATIIYNIVGELKRKRGLLHAVTKIRS